MPRTLVITGNEAAAWAARMADVKGVGFFPYGPADEVGEALSRWKSSGEHESTIIQMANETVVYTALLGMSSTGVRCIFATTSEGPIWAAQALITAVKAGCPIVMVVPGRTMGGSLLTDCRDFLSVKTIEPLSWYCESAQDIFDTTLQVFKIAEDQRVRRPAVVGYDGYGGISHADQDVTLPTKEELGDFLPPWTSQENYWERSDVSVWGTRRRMLMSEADATEVEYKSVQRFFQAPSIIEEVGREYQKITGSPHVGLIETYRMEDAEIALVTMGCINPTAKKAVDIFREEEGVKAGIVKPRLFVPFPDKAVRKALGKVKAFAVLARDPYFEVYRDVRAAVAFPGNAPPLMMARSVGVAGRDVGVQDIGTCLVDLVQAVEEGKVERELDYVPLRNRPEGDVLAVAR